MRVCMFKICFTVFQDFRSDESFGRRVCWLQGLAPVGHTRKEMQGKAAPAVVYDPHSWVGLKCTGTSSLL